MNDQEEEINRSASLLLPGVDSTSQTIEEQLATEPVSNNVLGNAACWESKKLWGLSWASVIITVFNFMLSLVTQMFVGHLGELDLAGASVANVGLQGLAYGIMFGMASAVQTVSGQAYGAKRYAAMGIICQRALLLHIVAAIPIAFLYWYSAPLLRAIGISTTIANAGQVYARGLLPQLVAFALYLPMQRFLQAQNVVNPMAYISITVFAIHVLISWAVVYKLQFGMIGAALALSFSWWLLAGSTWLYIVLSPACKSTWPGLSKKAFNNLWPYFKLTIASAIMLCLEIWYNQGVVLISGLLPNPEISLDSISICANYLNWDMMIMLGISDAVSVRISNELGACHPRVARLAVVVAVTICIAISVILSAILLIFKTPLIRLYTSSETVFEAVSQLVPLLAMSILLNGIQPILSGVAIGSGWQAIVAYVNVGAYYLVGLPIACVLGFKTSLGATGIWWGLLVGVFVQTVILIFLTIRTQWDKEVEKAIDRLTNSAEDDTLFSLVGDEHR